MKLRKGDAIELPYGRRSVEMVWDGRAFRVLEFPGVTRTPASIKSYVYNKTHTCQQPTCDGCVQVCICEALIAEGWI